MQNEQARIRYRQVIERIDQLPAFPALVNRLISVINSPDSSAGDAADLIEKDPALTSKMLRIANSAFYGMPRAISSVSSAVVILGFNTIRSLALSASLVSMFKRSGGGTFDVQRFWMHSIVCAMCSKAIIRKLMHVKMMDPESAFCAGLLHDIGKLILDQFLPEEYAEVCKHAAGKNLPLLVAEKELLGINHAELGKIIADKWALPLDLEYCIVYHHFPGSVDKIHDLVSAVHVANWMAHSMGTGTMVGECVPQRFDGALETLSLSQKQLDLVQETVADDIEKSSDFFTIISS